MGVEWRRKLPIAGHDTKIVEDDAGDGLRDVRGGIRERAWRVLRGVCDIRGLRSSVNFSDK